MKLYRPVKTNTVTQWFGQNLNPYYQKHGMDGHNGIDFKTWHGEPVYHSADWEGVVKTEVDDAGGIGVEIISKDKVYTDSYWKLKYWHLKKVNVYDGQEVKTGDIIGWADNSGKSTGNHLHWGLKPCDKNGNPQNRGNGYYGAIDPQEFFINDFILDILNLKQQLKLAQKVVKLLYVLKCLIKQKSS